MEVDITEKAKNFIRFGLLGLIVLAALAGGGLYLYQHSNKSFTVRDAVVVGSESVLTAKGDGKITELLVQDGDYCPGRVQDYPRRYRAARAECTAGPAELCPAAKGNDCSAAFGTCGGQRCPAAGGQCLCPHAAHE